LYEDTRPHRFQQTFIKSQPEALDLCPVTDSGGNYEETAPQRKLRVSGKF